MAPETRRYIVNLLGAPTAYHSLIGGVIFGQLLANGRRSVVPSRNSIRLFCPDPAKGRTAPLESAAE